MWSLQPVMLDTVIFPILKYFMNCLSHFEKIEPAFQMLKNRCLSEL